MATLCGMADARRLWQDSGTLEELAMSTVKEELTRLIQGQPDDSSREEIVRELAFHVMVERGLADSDAKRTISNEEMGRRIRSWQQ
jgi:predicted transcriptional regulator